MILTIILQYAYMLRIICIFKAFTLSSFLGYQLHKKRTTSSGGGLCDL